MNLLLESPAGRIVAALLETDDDFDPTAEIDRMKVDPEYDLETIKATCPTFFKSDKWFKTKGWRRYPGNYVVGLQTRRTPYQRDMTRAVIYQFRRSAETDEFDLYYVGDASDYEMARAEKATPAALTAARTSGTGRPGS